ncbi:Glycosylphosphatidylinositol anchor attachment 1 protein [Schistosoma japonicum]|uniref:Glycosylphosphatidylinositol anchor attachment 1 protein n=2 Tax=Schistosoma japonicum TaxID=6182 RepID=A0A4Z2DED1_SCHJA|nr:Glycosylphosphatidylinositol anchor attachment 1 protein [Schistosoma japonicum]
MLVFSGKERCLEFIEKHSTLFGLLLYLIGLTWFCLLSQDEFNHKTYMSENALLVGQVDEVFSDVSSSIKFYEESKNAFKSNGFVGLKQWLFKQLKNIGLEVYLQDFSFSHEILSPLKSINGSNLYSIMRSPSGGRTEALVIITALGDDNNSIYFGSLAYVLSLNKLFRNQVHWAKDIILLFPEYNYIGLMAWLEAYHGTANSNNLFWSELEGRSGSIQAGLSLEFRSMYQPVIDILPEGPNGLLANLDLVNTVVRLAEAHSLVTRVSRRSYDYTRGTHETRLNDMIGLLNGVWNQALNSPTGLHGPLINYQIPAITLQADQKKRLTDPRSSEILSVTRLLEGILRSVNNLQERLHQSFWYYLLPNPYRYISIGVYMPPALIMILSLLLKPLLFWIFLSKSKLNDDGDDDDQLILTEIDSFKASDCNSSQSDHIPNELNDDNPLTCNQIIRQRKNKSILDDDDEKSVNEKKNKHIELHKSDAELYSTTIPPYLLCLIIRVSLCFSMGFCLNSSPKYLFNFSNSLIGNNPSVRSNLKLNDVFLICITSLIFGMMIALPIIMLIFQKLMNLYEDDKRYLVDQLCLFGWSLFLSCLTCLNISSAVILSIQIVPLLHLFFQDKRSFTVKLVKYFAIIGWLIQFTPILIIIMCIVNSSIGNQQQHHYDNYFGFMNFSTVQNCYEKCILQSLIEADLFNCWTWSVITCGYTSLWFLTWLAVF